MSRKIRTIFIMVLTLLIFIAPATACQGNSAEPPSILIIVPGAPDDLEISINTGDAYIKAKKTDKGIEKYYTFYLRDLRNLDDYVLEISTGDISYNITIEKPMKSYNNIYTLNLEKRTLVPGKSLSRSISLVLMRLVLTLAIEAVVFWLFGFRSKKAWIAFLAINIFTQGCLNIWINGFSPLQSYMVLGLVFAEIQVIIGELCAFLISIKEHRLRIVFYVLISNLLSLFVGGYIITVLPV